ncbi:MAG: hypothetical protein MRQ07_05230, partial [Candidatus Midichloria sp.]|nr:hypothetical protein [Candidatus Midichloria sp.]
MANRRVIFRVMLFLQRLYLCTDISHCRRTIADFNQDVGVTFAGAYSMAILLGNGGGALQAATYYT